MHASDRNPETSDAAIRLLTDSELHREVLLDAVPAAKQFVWIATADIKDLHVRQGQTFIPFLAVLAQLLERGIEVRLLHAKEPGPRFREDFDRFPILIERLERMLCPRVHFKSIIVDGTWAYTGSANLTGAGLGAKHDDKRNFEIGLVSQAPSVITPIMETFDRVWMGAPCDTCARKEYCPEWPGQSAGSY